MRIFCRVGTSPGGLYPCKPGGADDYCYIFASRGNEEHWRRLATVIGREDLFDDPRLQNGDDRYKHKEVVNEAITQWTMQHAKEDVMTIIAEARVPCGAVFNTKELLNDADFLDRGMMLKIDHPERGEVTVPGWPLNMSDTKVPIKSAPLHGSGNESIYGDWLGCTPQEVADMRAKAVI